MRALFLPCWRHSPLLIAPLAWACAGADPASQAPDTLDGSAGAPTDATQRPSDAPTPRCVEETYPEGVCDHREYCRPNSGYACCYCVPADTSCGVAMAWICGDLYQDCPSTPPTLGTACNMDFPNLGCTYCDPPAGAYTCENGTWQKVVDELYCQTPIQHD